MKRGNVKKIQIESLHIEQILIHFGFFRILSGGLRMPDMSVRAIEDTDLKISDIGVERAPKEIQFTIGGEFQLQLTVILEFFKLNTIFKSFFIAKATVFNVMIRITSDSSQTIENAGYSIVQRAISIGWHKNYVFILFCQ